MANRLSDDWELPKNQDCYIKHLEEIITICQRENAELRHTIKHILDYIKEDYQNGRRNYKK